MTARLLLLAWRFSRNRASGKPGAVHNVVASIVALKAGRPESYAEKNLTVTANFSAQLDPAEGKQLLAAILSHTQPVELGQGAQPPPALPESGA